MALFQKIGVILVVAFYSIATMHAQINVYTQNCNTITPQQYGNGNTFNAGCYELPDQEGQVYSTSTQKEVVAEDHILLEEDVEFTASGSGQADLRIEELPFEVVAFENDLSSIKKYHKFELGISIPEKYIDDIQNFLDQSGSPQLNPYLSDEVEITALFENQLPGTNYTAYRKRQAFFAQEYTRDVSGFDDLYNHPYQTNNYFYWDPDDQYGGYYNGVQYQELGGKWTSESTDYPFRVRFAPPFTGTWSCKIIVDIKNGTDIYETPHFTFEVINSNKKGYLRVGKNEHFFRREGKTFMPVGLNNMTPIDQGPPLKKDTAKEEKIINLPLRYAVTPPIAVYEQYLRNIDTLAMNGVNFFRMMMNPWALEFEYEKLGDYTERQHIAKEMDLILEKAEEHDMLINWNLSYHARFSTDLFGIDMWDWIPNNSNSQLDDGDIYKSELNLGDVSEFFTNSQAKYYWKERLRYIVARWGYSPNIGMFEHLNEINEVGNATYHVPAPVITQWHKEMSDYLKDELDIQQLVTVSYTLEVDTQSDLSYWLDNVDVINVNNYNYKTQNVHQYHREEIPYKIDERGDLFNNGDWVWGNYNKPLFFSETGAHEVWNCDNGIESRRNIWQNMFWGVAGALDWQQKRVDPEVRDLSIYQRVAEFMDGVPLDEENWHSGMVKINKFDNNGYWRYKKKYRDDCIRDDETADVVYLRSGDKEKAFGVITNRRANYYTLGDDSCRLNKPAPEHSDDSDIDSLLQTYDKVVPGNFNDRLRLRNMKFGREYKIKYYSPYDQTNSIKEETKWGSKVTLDFPEMDTLNIVLFEAFLMGDNFKSMSNDSTNTEKETTREPKEKKSKEVAVYPNPNDGSFTVKVEKNNEVKYIQVVDHLGNLVKTKRDIQEVNHFNRLNVADGVYWIKVIFQDTIVYKKVVVH